VRTGRWRRDLALAVGVALASFAFAAGLDLHERFAGWALRYESWDADELAFGLAVLAGGLAWVAWRRREEVIAELRLRVQAERDVGELLAHNRELAQGLIALQENERRALARELHDAFGQACAAVRVETAWLRRALLAEAPGSVRPDGMHAVAQREGMQAAAERADAAARELHGLVRDMLRRLRPADLDALGLVGALQALCEAWAQRSGIACSFVHDGDDAVLDDAINVTVYRVVQEALTNVLRHARASAVSVRLAVLPGRALELVVHDDGRGMDVGAAGRGLGLLGATERAAAAGGTLEVTSLLGEGVRLALTIPLHAAEDARREAA
jgi:two-component system sensor histidine kinase UhpB